MYTREKLEQIVFTHSRNILNNYGGHVIAWWLEAEREEAEVCEQFGRPSLIQNVVCGNRYQHVLAARK